MSAAFSFQRVGAMVLRYSYLLRSSHLRILDMVYWPAVQLLTWGFLQTYLLRAGALNAPGGGAQAAGTLIGAGFMLYHLTMQNVSGYIGKPEDRTAHFSMVSLGFSLSALIGPLFAGFAIDGLGHRVAFALFAIPPSLHRFPRSMAQRTQELCAHLVDGYGGSAAAVCAGIGSAGKRRRRAPGSTPSG